MKNIREIIKEHTSYKLPGKELYDEQQVEQMLKEYGIMVVEGCAESADTKREYREGLDSGGYVNVVDKDSILRVKDSIK